MPPKSSLFNARAVNSSCNNLLPNTDMYNS